MMVFLVLIVVFTIVSDVLTGTHSCPKGSAFCRVINSTGANMGEPHSLLELQPDKFSIKMTYTSPDNVHGCIDQPVTTVIFRCPEKGMVSVEHVLYDVGRGAPDRFSGCRVPALQSLFFHHICSRLW